MAYALSLTIDNLIDASMTGTESERFEHTVRVAAGASDTSISLGGLTDPKIICVQGSEGVSVKLGSGGTDSLEANPVALVTDEQGLATTEVLISNSDGQEATVKILAVE